MAADDDESVLFGPEFPERMRACLEIAHGRRLVAIGDADELPETSREGKRIIIGKLGLARKHPALMEPWLEAVNCAFGISPPECERERNIRDMARKSLAEMRRGGPGRLAKLEELAGSIRFAAGQIREIRANAMAERKKSPLEKSLENEIHSIEMRLDKTGPEEDDGYSWDDIFEEEVVSGLMDELAEKRAMLAEAASEENAKWAEKIEGDEILLDAYEEQLAEAVSEARAHLSEISSMERWAAARALAGAGDIPSLAKFCYIETCPERRKEALAIIAERILGGPAGDGIGAGAMLCRAGASMLLRMVESPETESSRIAWKLALFMLERNRLNARQAEYLHGRAMGLEDRRLREKILSKMAGGRISAACGGDAGCLGSGPPPAMRGHGGESPAEKTREMQGFCDVHGGGPAAGGFGKRRKVAGSPQNQAMPEKKRGKC